MIACRACGEPVPASTRRGGWRRFCPGLCARLQTIVDRFVHKARERAGPRGLPVELDRVALMQRVRAGRCEATGLPLDLERSPKVGHLRPFAPSIDRVDSARGYTMDNVRVVCWAFNQAKGEWDDETLAQVAEAFLARRSSTQAPRFENVTDAGQVGGYPPGGADDTPARGPAPGTVPVAPQGRLDADDAPREVSSGLSPPRSTLRP